MSRYRVAIIGLGRMGWHGFPTAPNLATHTQAVLSHPRLDLVAGVDSDSTTRFEYQEEVHVRVYEDAATAIKDSGASIAIVATPAATHAQVVKQVATLVSGIVLEKPVAPSLASAKEIYAACEKIHLVVGHQRRYEQRHILMRHFIESGALGKPRAASCWFSGDILENGTHAADTLAFLVGTHTPSTITQVQGERFRVMVSCERGSLSLDSRTDLEPGYLHAMYDNLIGCIEGRERPVSSIDDGIEALRHALNYKEMREAAA